ncbi:MAG: hypothetical protein C4522_05565 [Desulfobacteraceae bacterium]|nr:MAG: hypothetical protein C4522_05565 [Desulfobacteraceae bacterium]
MPGFDRTGPMGAGPMTGGGRGRCLGGDVAYGKPFFRNRGAGLGRGMGYGCGFGRGRWGGPVYPAYSVSAGEEISRLKAEAEYMKNDLDRIHSRISDLEGPQSKE